MRLKFKGFNDLTKEWWNGYHLLGSFIFILASKLKAFKVNSK